MALSVSLAFIISSYTFVFASITGSASSEPVTRQAVAPGPELQLISATATATRAGIMLQWRTNSVPDNLGFNIYRLKHGERTQANREIIPGSVFAAGTPAIVRGGYSYSWFDRGGAADATYFIESVNVDGTTKIHQPIIPVSSKTVSEFEQTAEAANGAGANTDASTSAFEKNYPAEESQQPNLSNGTIQEQWAIASQAALKIAIKKDGWYRVTQPQMVAAGFNPAVDIRNLRLYVDANEVAINTSQFSGSFGSGDYIEFYGRGLDTPTTDTRIYYLIAGLTPGKRVAGEIKLDGNPILPPQPRSTPTPLVATGPGASSVSILYDPIFFSWAQRDLNQLAGSLEPKRDVSEAPKVAGKLHAENSESANPAVGNSIVGSESRRNVQLANSSQPTLTDVANSEQEQGAETGTRDPQDVSANSNGVVSAHVKTVAPKALELVAPSARSTLRLSPLLRRADQPVVAPGSRQLRKRRVSRKRNQGKYRRHFRVQRNHALMADGFAPANFENTIQIKDRLFYLSNVLNGEQENFFGRVISSTPVTQTLTVSNPDLTAGAATLEVALQGVANQIGSSHQVSVAFNGATIGSLFFGPLDHSVQSFALPMSQLQQGSNSVTFTKTSTGEVCLVDYIRLTYAHAFAADSGVLKFALRGSQKRKVDGFSTPAVRLIDYTDPLNVSLRKPVSEPSATGYAITVPVTESRSKAQRLLYAIPESQFEQPAALSLNQPSTLNLNSNAAAFLIISHKNFISSFSANVSPINTTLLAQRQSQGLSTKVVDVEDVYDEFGYGLHGPQAIKEFLRHASTHWTTTPRYIIFAGDASLDPRDYFKVGDFDFVPTKLVDATFNETASDDWLADFDNDGIANIPVGRLPLRNLSEASLVVSKLVNFTPVAPQAAMLIADDPGTPAIWDFETASDDVQALLPATMSVQRINVRTEPSPAQATADIINGFTQGRSVVNYSGHGNVDVWSGASIFTSANATALTNANKLSFVIVMDCLNGYYHDPTLLSLAEAFVKAPNGGAVAAFASSGLTTTFGQRQMELELYRQLYGSQSVPVGDAIKIAKAASTDFDVRTTWIFFGDPSIKIR